MGNYSLGVNYVKQDSLLRRSTDERAETRRNAMMAASVAQEGFWVVSRLRAGKPLCARR
jgi:hypothetical protein